MGVGPFKITTDPLKFVFYTFKGSKDPCSLAPSANPAVELERWNDVKKANVSNAGNAHKEDTLTGLWQ